MKKEAIACTVDEERNERRETRDYRAWRTYIYPPPPTLSDYLDIRLLLYRLWKYSATRNNVNDWAAGQPLSEPLVHLLFLVFRPTHNARYLLVPSHLAVVPVLAGARWSLSSSYPTSAQRRCVPSSSCSSSTGQSLLLDEVLAIAFPSSSSLARSSPVLEIQSCPAYNRILRLPSRSVRFRSTQINTHPPGGLWERDPCQPRKEQRTNNLRHPAC